jgi:hypothetical protein
MWSAVQRFTLSQAFTRTCVGQQPNDSAAGRSLVLVRQTVQYGMPPHVRIRAASEQQLNSLCKPDGRPDVQQRASAVQRMNEPRRAADLAMHVLDHHSDAALQHRPEQSGAPRVVQLERGHRGNRTFRVARPDCAHHLVDCDLHTP